ncbi:glycine cleavage system protein GcvH [soil metagenome]
MDPKTLKYAESHEWAAVEGDTVTIGITQFAADQLTDVTYLELPKVGKVLKAGDEFGVVESVKMTSPLYAPVAGEVIAVNDAPVKDTGLINSSPFEKGWMMKIKLAPGASAGHLKNFADYEKQIAEGH